MAVYGNVIRPGKECRCRTVAEMLGQYKSKDSIAACKLPNDNEPLQKTKKKNLVIGSEKNVICWIWHSQLLHRSQLIDNSLAFVIGRRPLLHRSHWGKKFNSNIPAEWGRLDVFLFTSPQYLLSYSALPEFDDKKIRVRMLSNDGISNEVIDQLDENVSHMLHFDDIN